MKKTKIALGLSALAAAALLSFASSTSNANSYYTGRAGTAPNYSPAGTQILNPNTQCKNTGVCGYEFTDEDVYVGEIPGRFQP